MIITDFFLLIYMEADFHLLYFKQSEGKFI